MIPKVKLIQVAADHHADINQRFLTLIIEHTLQLTVSEPHFLSVLSSGEPNVTAEASDHHPRCVPQSCGMSDKPQLLLATEWT
jgi:hypothetical protein